MIHRGVAFWRAPSEALQAPTGVTASRNGLDIDVAWSHAGGGGATGFRVYRRSRTVGGSFGSYVFWRLVTPETDTDTTDDTAVGELEYQYRVHAWDGSTESAGAESPVVGAVDPIEWDIGLPGDYAPDDTSVVWGFFEAIDSAGLQVWYRVGASMGGNPVGTGILAYEGILTSGTINLGATDTTAFIVARARYGTPGNYRYGPWSEERGAISRPRVPGAPTSVVFTKTDVTEGELTWSAGSPATQTIYDIEYAFRAAGSGSAWSAWADPFPDTSVGSPYLFDEVIEGNEYKLRVRARNTGGSSAWVESNVVAFADPPNAPSGLSAVLDVTYPYSFVDLSWTDNSIDETAFRIERAVSPSGAWSPVGTVAASVTSFEDQSAGPPVGSAPTIVSAESVDDDRLDLVISGLPSNATGWEVYYVASSLDMQVDDTGVSTLVVAGTGTTASLTGLAADQVHGLRVCATNGAGRGRPSDLSQATTGPTAPKTLAAVVNGGNHDLTWDIGSRDDDAVLVERRIGAGAWSQIASRPAGSTSYSVTAIGSASYRVRFSGEATYSNEVTP